MEARQHSVRTCVGCRQKDDRGALLRFVVAGEPPQIVPDVARKAGGRGVSVHPRRRCIDAAVKSGAIRRGLRASLSPSADELASWALGQYERKLAALLAVARRSGHLAAGTERVRDAIHSRRAALLVVASDATDARQELMRAAERLGAACLVHGDKSSLGRLFGRESVAVAAITDRALASELKAVARCAADISEGA